MNKQISHGQLKLENKNNAIENNEKRMQSRIEIESNAHLTLESGNQTHIIKYQKTISCNQK